MLFSAGFPLAFALDYFMPTLAATGVQIVFGLYLTRSLTGNEYQSYWIQMTKTWPNTSLEPTGVGAVSSAARFTSQFAGGSVLGR